MARETGAEYHREQMKLKLEMKRLELEGARAGYDTIRYDSVCLTCSKKLTGSQLSLPR